MQYEYFNIEKLVKNKSEIKKIFFYRVCGTGMGAAASLLKEQGYHVEGADMRFYPPMSDYLKKVGIKCVPLKELSESYLRQFDLIVVGNVVPKASEDAKFIESLGIPFASFPAAMGALVLKDVNVVGVAGTHGKTTTTYLFAQVFEKMGYDPGYFIGGVLEEGRPSSRRGDGKYFFIESDEYDSAYFEKFSKFRSYFLNSMVLTSLEFDHADIFKNLDQIKNEFKEVLPHLDKNFIFNLDYEGVKQLIVETIDIKAKQLAYGQASTLGPQVIHFSETGTSFSLRLDSQEELFETNLVGVHNILNLSTVIIFAHSEGIELQKIKMAIKDLKMVRRRQEIRGTYKGSIVIDDFAHHPTAVYLTIDGIRQRFPDKKLTVIFEPNSATARSNIFQDEFYHALKRADNILVTKLERPTSISGKNNIDVAGIVEALSSKDGKFAKHVKTLDELQTNIDLLAGPENLFLVLSNGTCLGLWESEFVNKLQK